MYVEGAGAEIEVNGKVGGQSTPFGSGKKVWAQLPRLSWRSLLRFRATSTLLTVFFTKRSRTGSNGASTAHIAG